MREMRKTHKQTQPYKGAIIIWTNSGCKKEGHKDRARKPERLRLFYKTYGLRLFLDYDQDTCMGNLTLIKDRQNRQTETNRLNIQKTNYRQQDRLETS